MARHNRIRNNRNKLLREGIPSSRIDEVIRRDEELRRRLNEEVTDHAKQRVVEEGERLKECSG